jgi:hypothetical protein
VSNPLLRPGDPRFQQREMRDADGKNRFAESDPKLASGPAAPGDIYATPSEDPRPFNPQFEVQQHARPELLFVLAAVGWGAAIIGAVSLVTTYQVGWISPLIGVIPAGAAWFLAHEELKAIASGAIAASARDKSRYAYWLGITGLVACAAVVAVMIYREMHFLPEI